MNILGIAGKKQSGKNTTANIIHGLVLMERGMIKDFNIDNDGKLFILTSDAYGTEDWGEFDITRKDRQFVEWAEYNMWPYVKLYSFADTLKWICIDLFNIPPECVYGTDEQKNRPIEHLKWDNMPGVITPIGWSILEGKLNPEIQSSPDDFNLILAEGPMTAREFMQYLGTEVMRRMYLNVWVESTLNKIQKEGSELAIIADARFPNEVNAIINRGGKVLKLNRNVFNDQHASEIALDSYDDNKFLKVIENNDIGVCDLLQEIKSVYKNIRR